MTAHTLFWLWPLPIVKAIRRWAMRRKLAHISYSLTHIVSERENGYKAERHLQGLQAVTKSDLHNL
jgi:hypothetical protein